MRYRIRITIDQFFLAEVCKSIYCNIFSVFFGILIPEYPSEAHNTNTIMYCNIFKVYSIPY